MAVAASQASAHEMKVICLLIPSGTQNGLSAGLQRNQLILGSFLRHLFIADHGLHSHFPGTFKIQTVITSKAKKRILKQPCGRCKHIPKICPVAVPVCRLGMIRLAPQKICHGHRSGRLFNILRHRNLIQLCDP